MWPFKSKAPTHCSFPVGPYTLNMPAATVGGLTEISAQDYAVFGRQFRDERICHAPRLQFLGRQWEVMLGIVGGVVYKIAPSYRALDKADANNAAISALSYCTEHLGRPAKQRTGLFIWDTTDGNVIMQTAETADGLVVNLFLTSNVVRSSPRLG